MKKILIVVTLIAFAFGLPMLSWSQSNSSFLNQPIQSDPQKGQGDRFVGNTQVQIVAPPAASTKIEGEKAAAVPNTRVPETVVVPDRVPYKVQPSNPQ